MGNYQSELQIIGSYPSFPGTPDRPKYNTPITPRENVQRSYSHKELWTPSSVDFQTLSPKLIPDNIARGFVLDKNVIDNDTEAGGPDMFGVVWEWVPQVGGSMVRAEDKQLIEDIADWESILNFPNPADWDWAGSGADNAPYLNDERPVIVWFQNGLFERLISFMGFENAAVALVYDEQKPFVHAIFERLCDLYEDIFARFKEYYHADVIYFHDDWGGQNSPFFSQDTVREMIFPYLKRLVDFVHGHGMGFHFHSCGKIEMLVPLMIEAGVDVWAGQAINDQISVLEKYAGQIRIEAGPEHVFGGTYTAEEVEGFTEKFLTVYGPYLDNILLTNRYGTPEGSAKLYELAYEYSRSKFNAE
ncbi:MAG: methyltransferase [Clostridiales Family XIII bacterium]|jgi:hypothetical protein|nr:methyltransferase [Clostridiales Family XIII bacterium]